MAGIESVYNGLRLLREAAKSQKPPVRLIVESGDGVLIVTAPEAFVSNDDLEERMDEMGWSSSKVGAQQQPTLATLDVVVDCNDQLVTRSPSAVTKVTLYSRRL